MSNISVSDLVENVSLDKFVVFQVGEPEIFSEDDVAVLTGDGFVLVSMDHGIIKGSEYLQKGRWREHVKKGSIKSCRYLSGEYVLAGMASKDNYYHWVKQVFFNLLYLLENRKSLGANERVSVIGPRLNNFSKQYLDMIEGINYVEVGGDEYLHVEKLEFSDILWDKYVFSSSKVFSRLAKTISERVGLSSSKKRIYISRGDTNKRRVSNESSLVDFLSNYNFVSIEMSRYSVEEQIALFRDADVVVAPHGAGLTNLLFSRPGQLVIELFQESYLNQCFWAIADGNGLDYRALINPVESKGSNKHFDSMIVDLNLLENVFDNEGLSK